MIWENTNLSQNAEVPVIKRFPIRKAGSNEKIKSLAIQPLANTSGRFLKVRLFTNRDAL